MRYADAERNDDDDDYDDIISPFGQLGLCAPSLGV
jgi:hypothetical protein